MNSRFKYKLDLSSNKFLCPSCGKKRFVRYIDTTNNQFLEGDFGRCDREVDCGYFRKPKDKLKIRTYLQKFKQSNKIYLDTDTYMNFHVNKYGVFSQSDFGRYLFNTAYNYFESTNKKTQYIFHELGLTYNKYRLGIFGDYTLFPMIDSKKRLHYVQAKVFDFKGHSIHKHTTSFAKMINVEPDGYADQDYKIGSLFGEHLLNKTKQSKRDFIIVVVEAPKTALLLDLIFNLLSKNFHDQHFQQPYIFLSTMSLGLFNERLLQPLRGLKVLAIPDFDDGSIAFAKWLNIELKLNQKGFNIRIKSLEGKKVKNHNWDIADFLTYDAKFKLEKFLDL